MGTPVSQASPKELSKLLTDLIWLLGVNTAKQGEGMADQLIRMSGYLLQKYGQSTLEDIRLAYDLAVEGHLGIEVISKLDPLQFGKVMSAYRQYCNQSVAIQQKGNNQPLFSELPATQDYIDQTMKMYLWVAYRTVQDGDTYPDLGSGLYDWLDSKGLIPFDAERKWAFFSRAKAEVQQLTADSLSTAKHLSGHQKAPLRKILKAALNDALDKNTSDKIRAHAKYLALNELLSDLIEMGVPTGEFFLTISDQ